MSRFPFAPAASIIVSLALAACAYQGSGVGNPLSRTAVWFSFLGGDDIRAACVRGASARYRFVYNGRYREQVRIYEVGGAAAHRFDARVIGSGSLTGITIPDPFAPWNGTAKSTTLSEQQYAALDRSLAESGVFAATPGALELPADRFYWTAATCRDGVFHLNAWLFPSERFRQITFDRWLLAFDPTEIAFNPPRLIVPNDPREYEPPTSPGGINQHPVWSIRIEADHVVGDLAL